MVSQGFAGCKQHARTRLPRASPACPATAGMGHFFTHGGGGWWPVNHGERKKRLFYEKREKKL